MALALVALVVAVGISAFSLFVARDVTTTTHPGLSGLGCDGCDVMDDNTFVTASSVVSLSGPWHPTATIDTQASYPPPIPAAPGASRVPVPPTAAGSIPGTAVYAIDGNVGDAQVHDCSDG